MFMTIRSVAALVCGWWIHSEGAGIAAGSGEPPGLPLSLWGAAGPPFPGSRAASGGTCVCIRPWRHVRVPSPSGARTQFQQRGTAPRRCPREHSSDCLRDVSRLAGDSEACGLVCRRRVVVFGLCREGFSGACGHVPMKSAVCVWGGGCSPETLAVVETLQLVS